MNDKMEFVARILLAQVFIVSSLTRVSDYSEAWNHIVSAGVPGGLVPMIILLEILGGICLLLGCQTKFISAVLALYSIVAAVTFHGNLIDDLQLAAFIKSIAVTGGLLMLISNGTNAFSFDALKFSRESHTIR